MKSSVRVIINKVACSYFIPNSIRRKLLNICGMDLDDSSRIMSNCFFDTNLIYLGKNSFINRFCQFHDGDHGGKIRIEDDCMIAMNVNFCTVSHEIGNSTRRSGKAFIKNIHVKSGCWIGANCTILPGVTINEGCIIAAGSIVSKDCDSNGLYGGVPAKLIKKLV